MEKYILVLDIGSTNVKASLVDKNSKIFSSASSEFPLLYPGEGMVEESGTVLWGTVMEMIRKVMTKSAISEEQILSLGITNQRETFLLWDKETGLPVYNAIGWQDQRGKAYSDRLVEQGYQQVFYEKTGLLLNNFMPCAGKITWLLDHVEGVRKRAEGGKLLFGTIDTWIIWNLTGGKKHCTDVSNASRTMLFNLHTLQWDDEFLKLFRIPSAILPEIQASGSNFGETTQLFRRPIPILSAIGDQHAATFGQRCFKPGMMKATYGSSCVIMVNNGNDPAIFPGLCTTVGWQLGQDVTYLFEGGFYVAGFALKWLRDSLQMASDYETMNHIAEQTQRTDGLYVCPLFLGAATPYHNTAAKGLISGLQLNSGPNDLIKATFDSLAYTTNDSVAHFRSSMSRSLQHLAVDGGVTASDYVMQMVSNITRLDVSRSSTREATTIGAAYIAGLVCELWTGLEDIEGKIDWEETLFTPQMEQEKAETLYNGWRDVMGAVLSLNQ